ncbi:carboxypeptidase A, putative [Pediculus humanus corporis]|uniref:Carboxypeptidase A, putative n=1 Tax=Pediculus humanus subsp. corporis TaxID=121224 RepID=E0V9S1_PEDHC|nr:carboxypeptidase A, putative [Pediculus humanus corporis]EEB10127.1 carboxypeptidase A, putative [Pediculus humanus corporis]
MIRYINSLRDIKNYKNESVAVVENIGKSYHGRDMFLVKVSSDHSAKKPVIFFEIGIHAREWLAHATGLYMLHQLVENFENNSGLLDKIDYYMIPVTNPDGYEYSREKNRLWRKTRSLFGGAYGTDGNRNFDFHWGEGGTSSDPRSEIFKGPYPFSEVEMRNVRDAGAKYAPRIKTFVSVHCYGPYILYPWSYKTSKPAPQAELMDKIGREAALAIKKYNGTKYAVGSSTELLYEAAGGSDDYFKGVLGVDLSFTVELSSAGRDSFVVPASEIHGVASEAFEGFKVMAKYAANYKKNK